MPSAKKRKDKTRRYREQDILSDIENVDIMLRNPDLNSLGQEKNSLCGSIGPINDDTSSMESQRERSSQENGKRGNSRNAASEFPNNHLTRKKD